MPFDNNGNFQRLHCWEEDRENNIDIVAERADEEDNNFADGLSQCFLRNGSVQMQGEFNAGHFRVKNVANAIVNSDAVNKSQLDAVSESVNQCSAALAAKIQEVDAEPQNPVAGVLYVIPED